MAVNTTALQARVRQFASAVMDDTLTAMPDQMRPYAPVGKGPGAGRLQQSIQRDQGSFTTGDTIRGRIIAPVIQAKTTDQGSPPHVIRPKRIGGLLVFEASSGERVFARIVHHPGNEARPWWERALRASFEAQLRYAAIQHSTR